MKVDKRISYTIRAKANSTDFIIIKSKYKSGKIDEKTYREVEFSSICKMVEEGAVNLDNCYIKDFSYKAIEKKCENWVVLNNFSARYAFFDGTVDFSGANFNGAVYFNGAEFNGAVDFASAKFREGGVSFWSTNFNGAVNFHYAEFNGTVDFRDARFGEGEVSFREVNFGEGEVSFLRAQFSEVVDFRAAEFNGAVDFRDARFGEDKVSFARTNFGEGGVSFCNANFNGAVDFSYAVFGEGEVCFRDAKFGKDKVSFARANFGEGDVSFCNANFNGAVDFSYAMFGEGKVDFQGAQFSGNLVFIEIDFTRTNLNFKNSLATKATVRFKGCKFANHDNLRFQDIKKLEILDCTIEKTMLLNSTENNKVNIAELSFQDTRNLGAIYIDWDTAKNAIKNYGEDSSQESKANQMKLLKENFNRIQEYDCEDEAFVEYMRYDRKTKNMGKKFLLYLLDWIGAYGTNPWRVAGTMAVIIVLSSLFYMLGGDIDVKVSENCFFESIYFSVITFLTIGYGDLSPKNEITAAVAAVEGFFGLFLMSYFVVALVRKTLR